MGRAAPDVPDSMRGIHGRFERWRQSHTGRLPIPESLWMAAAEVARKHGVDLIVMGTHGRAGLAHVLLGSVAERVVRKAPCPVLTVKHPEHEFVMP